MKTPNKSILLVEDHQELAEIVARIWKPVVTLLTTPVTV